MSRYPRAIAGRGGFHLTKGMFLPPFNDRAFPIPLLDLPLTTSIIPRNSVAIPSFSRNSIATFDDWEGKVRIAIANEARFQGARRVRNRLNSSEILPTPNGAGVASLATVAAGFIAPDGTPSAFRLTTNLNGGVAGTDSSYADFDVGGPTDFTTPVHSVWLKNNGGASSVLLRQSSATLGYVVSIDNIWRRYTVTSAAVLGIVGGMFTIGQRGNINPGAPLDLLYWHPQLEDVVGQSNVAPAEYVSKGVLATPYHGANVDGVKYFDTLNPNIVTGSVVTVSTAAPTAIAGCQYWSESQKINLCLQSEDFTTTWAVIDTVITPNALIAPDGNLTADLATEGSAGTAILAQAGLTIVAGNTVTASVFMKRGNHDFVVLIVGDNGAATGFRAWFNLNTGAVGASQAVGTGTIVGSTITNYQNGWYRLTLTGTVDPATTTAARFFITSALADTNPARVANATHNQWGAQFEVGGFASKYIPTVAVTVTRLIDALSYPNAGSMNATQGSCYAEAQTEWSLNESSVWLVGTDGNGRLLFISGPGSAPSNSSIKDAGVGAASGAGASMFGAIKKSGSTWNGIVGKAYYEGAAVGTGALTGAMSLLTNIGIGVAGSGGGNAWSGGIKNVKIWDRALSDAQMKSIVGSV